jgi:hypothetical protein
MVNYEKDYLFGEKQEKKIEKYLEAKWEGIVHQDRYIQYDFINDKVNIEVKSRKYLNHNSYPTTLLTMNKISPTSTKKTIFVFNFVFDMTRDMSEIYYIEYNEAKFSKYNRKMFSRANIKSDEKEYIYIPSEDLTLLHRDEYAFPLN